MFWPALIDIYNDGGVGERGGGAFDGVGRGYLVIRVWME